MSSGPNAVKNPLAHPVVLSLATKYRPRRKSCSVGTSSTDSRRSPSRYGRSASRKNIDIFDFQLTADKVASLDALETGADPEIVDTKMFVLKIPD
jgi:hypothetical protein